MDKILAVLSRTADGVFALDAQQRIVFWNEAAKRLMGYTEADVLGQFCHHIFDGDPRPGCLTCGPECPVMLAASRQEPVPTYSLLSHTKAGETILLSISVIVPPDTSPDVVSIHLFRDATRQLRYETYVDQILCAAARLPQPQTTWQSQLPGPMSTLNPLSGREKDVLFLLVQGKNARGIADTLCISYSTVRNHLQAILRKLGVHSQREAIKLAIEHRLV